MPRVEICRGCGMGDVSNGMPCTVCPQMEIGLGIAVGRMHREQPEALDQHVPPGINPPVAGASLDDILDAVRELKAEIASLRQDLEEGIEVVKVEPPSCTNCDNRKCMECVCREWHEKCRENCPSCC